MSKQPTCPSCGAPGMVHETRPDVVEYTDGGVTLSREIMQPGWWCNACGEALFTGAEARMSFEAHQELRAEAKGVLSPAQVRTIRERLGLSQRQAGIRLGGGVKAFNKYESGSIVPSQALSNLLRVLDAHPEALDLVGAAPAQKAG
ncbi:MAG: type II toxin-antitoxin system MqsA family antitoxin [Bradymonadia bacterium]